MGVRLPNCKGITKGVGALPRNAVECEFFDTMPHQEILAVLAQRITDVKFLRLIARMLKAGVQTPGGVVQDELGSPQGSIVSPVIANAFLDTVQGNRISRYCIAVVS